MIARHFCAGFLGFLIGLSSIGLKASDLKNVDQILLAGKAIYHEHCATCHGDKLQGQPNWQVRNPDGTMPAPPHDETGHTAHHADWQLFETVKTGRQPFRPPNYKSGMPPFRDVLSDLEIWMVLAFIKSTWPEKMRRRQEEINRTTLR